MSHEPDVPVKTEAKRHTPAIIGIIVALAAAALAFMIFGADTNDVDMEPAPSDTAAKPDTTVDDSASETPAPAN